MVKDKMLTTCYFSENEFTNLHVRKPSTQAKQADEALESKF